MENIYILKGLDCANCAEKISQRLQKLPNVEDVEYSFLTGKYTVISTTKVALDEVKTIVNKLEPDVIVEEYTNNTQLQHNTAESCNCAAHDHDHTHNHNHAHEHTHSHTHTNTQQSGIIYLMQKNILGRIFISLALLILLHFVTLQQPVKLIAYLVVFILIGGEIVYSAIRNVLRGEWFDENFLMTVATIGAFAIGEYPEAVAVMLFYQIGEYFQDRAVENSRKSIAELMDIRPDYANLKQGKDIKKVAPEQVNIADLILVKPGEKIPLDGEIVEGESFLDTTALTGESVPRKASVGDAVLSGVVNKNGVLTIRVTKPFGESTVSKILNLVENASSKKAPTEKFITKFSHYYTPAVVFSAVALTFIPPLFFGLDTFYVWLERALTFLVISCPCALVISVPLGFFGGIGLASKNGILIKGGNFLESLSTLDSVVFDKTGTLTKGQFAIVNILPANNYTADDVLKYATYGEWFSSHPIALAIKEKQIAINDQDISAYEEVAGQGIQLRVKEHQVLVGNYKLMKANNIEYIATTEYGTLVYVAIDGKFAGTIIIADELKADAKATIRGLNQQNIHTIMLTGDNQATADHVANELAIETYHAELLPQQKVEEVNNILDHKNGAIMFVGDGINDAPVLAQADVGVSMGALGSDAAIEASDIVLMSDEPSKILTSIKISKTTKKIVWQNIIFALTVKAIVLILGAFGYASMWAAVFADVGVSFLAILNSIRIIRMKIK